MVDFENNKTRKLLDVADVERAKSGKIYKAGSLYIKLSACDEFVGYLEEDGEIETRYAVIMPKDGINPKYFFYAFSREFPQFLSKYQTTINLQFDVIQKMKLQIHEDPGTQEKIVEMMEMCEVVEEKEEKFVEFCKTAKQYFLGKMMA